MNGVADPAKVGPTWVRWRIVGLLMALSYISWFLRKSMPVAYVERIQTELKIDETQMGWVYTIFLLTYMFCMTPGGWLIDRWGTRVALTVMGLGLALFGALTGMVGTFSRMLPPEVTVIGYTLATPLLLFLLIRAVMGVFATPMYPAAAHAVSIWVPFRRAGWANGLIQASAAIGIATAPLVVGTLIVRFDWPQTFVILAVATGLLTVVWALYATDRPAQHRGINPAERDLIAADKTPASVEMKSGHWTQLFRNRSLVLLTTSYAALNYFEYLFFFWMDYYFEKQLKLPDEVRRIYAGIPFLTMAVGMCCGGWLSDRLVRTYGYRLGRAIVPVVGMVLAAAFLLVGIMVTDPLAVLVSFSIALAAAGAVEAPTWTTAVELGGRRSGMAAGMCNTGGNAGGLIAPVLTPFVASFFAQDVGWKYGIGLGGAICLVGVVLWIWIDPRERVAE